MVIGAGYRWNRVAAVEGAEDVGAAVGGHIGVHPVQIGQIGAKVPVVADIKHIVILPHAQPPRHGCVGGAIGLADHVESSGQGGVALAEGIAGVGIEEVDAVLARPTRSGRPNSDIADVNTAKVGAGRPFVHRHTTG